ncbi:MAG: PQQ-binding-like beta-propeller repeat protein [Bacteroidales bacterium]|jgi:outer membrane protein assembly factor BamB|nr:PQQ-binding-like beta-propeller repeat protein [Bacteroidales bacterium]
MILERIKRDWIFGLIAAVLAAVLLLWLFTDKYSFLSERLPGMDNRPEIKPRDEAVVIGEFFDSLGILEEHISGSWPRFRGTYYDNISRDTTPLADSWDSTGPPVVWRAILGEGYAGAAVNNGRVYILDYDERRKADMLRCFSLNSGTELWRRWYYVDIKRNHGYSRTIPAIAGNYLVTLGPRSHVMCLDPVSGELRWSLDLEKKYALTGKNKGAITPDFYSGQCPLIDDGVAVFAPGSKALMIGVDCETGKILWETPNPDTVLMSHCSIMPMELHGKRMYVYHGVGGVCGVSAERDDTGELLWRTDEWSPAIVAASPLYLGNNEIAVFGAYGTGGARIKIHFENGIYTAEVLEKHKSINGLSSDQQTPVLLDEHIWCLMPENGGELKRQLTCWHRSNLLTPVWSSGKENRYGRGLGPYIVSGDKMYLLDDDGNLFMFRIEGTQAKMLASHKMLDGIEAWGPMAIAGGLLLMRDARNLLCIDISEKSLMK